MFPHLRRFRSLPRYRKILSVFARHGFGVLMEQLKLDHYLNLPRTLLRQSPSPPQLTPAEHLRLALEELGPTFIKLGQIGSTRPDLLPTDFVVELAKLQDCVNPEHWDSMKALLIEEYGQDFDQIFAEVDPAPLGAASLAQVHAGRLMDGSAVVLKIQRPNILATIEADLEILADLAGLIQRSEWGRQYNPVEILNNFTFTLHNELDFRLEGANADRFRANFANESHLYIPKIYWEWSTRRILIEERIEGIKIDQGAALEQAGFNPREVAEIAAGIMIKEFLEDGFFHADPHPGNFYVMRDDVTGAVLVGAMDFGMVGYISHVDRLNLLQGFMLAARLDSAGLVEHMVRIGAVSSQADLPKLEHDLDSLLNRYHGLTLKNIYTRKLIEELMALSYQHHVNLPPDFWMLFKTLTMMDGLARQLDPEINVFDLFGPSIERLMRRMYLPWVWGPAFMSDLETLAFAVRDAPQIGERILRGLQRGEIPFSMKAGLNKDTLDRIDRVSTRISISLLVAAFIVGTALIFPTARDNPMAMAFLVVGFIFSLGLGVWFIISTLRSGRG
jgi:ubiquinone biosynthesis protein